MHTEFPNLLECVLQVLGRVHEEGICREYFSLESEIGLHIADPQIC